MTERTNGPPNHRSMPGNAALWSVGAPAMLVFLWSTGFVGAKWGLPYAEPFTFVAIRFALAASILTVFALCGVIRGPSGNRFSTSHVIAEKFNRPPPDILPKNEPFKEI